MVSENTPPDEGQKKDESVKPSDGAKKKDEKKVVELSEEDLQIKETSSFWWRGPRTRRLASRS